MFEKILIANRGEIAVRVIRACQALGIRAVAIHSEVDREALHVRMADEAYECGPARATESYLDGAGIIEIAKRVGVDALHPGYGFLSENADFAEAVAAAGIRWIGPSPDVIRKMGRKIESRRLMRSAGVPVVPGVEEIVDFEQARAAAERLGYPVLVKASAGGGGRGMRRVEDATRLEEALERAASEADAAFGDGTIYLEKVLAPSRHVEIQVVADTQGHVVHLGERECSIQRRHQKLVEEAPAHGMSAAHRAAMGAAAVSAARAVGYEGVGTCEFLMDESGEFFFLEMNTRIQVEHPVTEAVTGVDLVALQIRIAVGETLPFSQDDVSLEGHAIEVRIYAEDPEHGFVPSPGLIAAWNAPGGPCIRLDSGFEAGQTITSHYDPMLAKLIARGRDRTEALANLRNALDAFWIAGIRTGLPFLRRLVENPTFRAGAYDTDFIESEMSAGPSPLSEAERDLVFAVVAHRASTAADARARKFRLGIPKQESVAAEVLESGRKGRVRVANREISFETSSEEEPIVSVDSAGRALRFAVVPHKRGGFEVGLRDRVLRVDCRIEEVE